ncbi:NAD(P)/FAD-dependent oxidoreductase [Candidatus Saccharibacteria bacterium]|nr:NAD(P)/FAD-dependent oxidoreductase [Candidatus Saccharibacteria bacterium]
MLDLAIIGSGPAALTAAIYASRAGLTVEVIEKNRMGGSLPDISYLANFPGFDGSGQDLANRLLGQIKNLGVYNDFGVCDSIKPFKIDGEEKFARSILVATGTEPIHLDLPIQKPVYYTVPSVNDNVISQNVLVIGGGNFAVSEALYLAKNTVKNLTLISHTNIKAEKRQIDELRSMKHVTIYENYEPTVDFLNAFDAIFVLVGKKPMTSFLPKELLDDDGFIITDTNYMTKIPGVFAAGDVRSGTLKQPLAAASDGAIAAINISDFLSLGKHY